jgi:hypothetical protein
MKYLLTLYGEEGGWDDVTPEEMQAGMEPWVEFDKAVTGAGAFVAGEGLQPSSTATTVKIPSENEHVVTDGPFAETKEQLGGFYLLECKNLDEALEWAKKVPMTPPGSIEVRPVMDYSEFGFEHASEGVESAS